MCVREGAGAERGLRAYTSAAQGQHQGGKIGIFLDVNEESVFFFISFFFTFFHSSFCVVCV